MPLPTYMPRKKAAAFPDNTSTYGSLNSHLTLCILKLLVKQAQAQWLQTPFVSSKQGYRTN